MQLSSQNMPLTPRIAIVGGGPAGLTLARLLLVSKAKVELTIYELDASATSRLGQGGTLDLHTSTGLAALRKCDLWEAFLQYASYAGDEKTIADKNATVLVHVGGGEKGTFDRPEIDRQKLKKILVESISPKLVKWGRKLKEVTDDGMLKFDGVDKMEGPFDLIVGADGAWSKVRARLTDIKPVYSGVSGYEMAIPYPAKTCPHVHKMVGKGSYFTTSDAMFLNSQRQGDGSLKVRSWFRCPEGVAKEVLNKEGKEKTLKLILERYHGWAPEVLEFLKQGDLETLMPWTLYELPVGTKWKHQKGLTLIGDASSLATPFSGEGVNKAMQDAVELADLIERSQDPRENLTLDQAVIRFEKSLFVRSEKLQAKTMFNKQNVFGPGAPIAVFTGQMRLVAADSSSMLVKVVGTAPVLALVHCLLWVWIQVGWAVRKFWRGT
jgi:2-polyprenyl-6-methoxyphenol hydroxylase-like FAD-dependent oxidoreductase